MRLSCLLILFILGACTSYAQLCTGSLGDPVATVTFGVGTSAQGSPLPAGKTNYGFQTGCPADGFYNITNLSFNCFEGTWHTLIGDHTPGDAGGYYMMVNASETPGIFYQDTINNLCGNTTYEFSSYVVNLLKPNSCGNNGIQPDLTFIVETISGTNLIRYNSGKIPPTVTPQWKQYGTFLTTPNDITQVVVKIINNAPGGCGNDLALDDLQFRPCGPKVDVGINGISIQDTAFCEGNNSVMQLQGTYSDGYIDPRVQWQFSPDSRNWTNIPGATTTSLTRTHPGRGEYFYRMLIGEGNNILGSCRIASSTVHISVSPPPFVRATNYIFGCLGSVVPFYASGADSYVWNGPNGRTWTTQDPEINNVSYRDSGMYYVRGTSSIGCASVDSTYLQVFENARASVPGPLSVCEGIPLQLIASGGTRYKWDPGAHLNNDTIASPVIRSPINNERYRVRVTNQFGCTDTASVYVTVFKKPIANAGPDLKMLKGNPIRLKSSVAGTNVQFNWTPTNGIVNPESSAPTVNPETSIRYRLTVSSGTGCGTSSDEVEVQVLESIRVPNTFTPNGDGYNDVWQIELLDIFERSVTEVYNPAGQLMFRSVGYGKPWDGKRNGKPLPAGTYYYVIDLKTNADRLTGYVTIIR